MPDARVTGNDLLAALCRLGAVLHERGITADIYVFGGAAMVIAYQARPATRDIDAIFVPNSEVVEAAKVVARERGWPRSWLNDQASVYLGGLPDQGQRLMLDAPGIRCMAASPERLLAMKVIAARQIQDATDIRFLVDLLELDCLEDVLRVVGEVFPGEQVSDRARLLIEDILDQRRGSRS